MNGFGNQFLPGSALAANEHRHIALADFVHQVIHMTHRFTVADEAGEPFTDLKFFSQLRILALQQDLLNGVPHLRP